MSFSPSNSKKDRKEGQNQEPPMYKPTKEQESTLRLTNPANRQNMINRTTRPALTGIDIQDSPAEQYYLSMQRAGQQAIHSVSYPDSSSPNVLVLPFASHHFSSQTWNSNFNPDPSRNQPEIIQSSSANGSVDPEVMIVNPPDSQTNSNINVAMSPNFSLGASNLSRNPHFASLIQTQNVLCRQLEQLTDHNIHLATRNSALRAELEQAKEENLQMLHIRQMQAQQAYKQAADYETLLAKYEKSGETIRLLKGKKASEDGEVSHHLQYDENLNVKASILEKENNMLREHILELEGKNRDLERRIEELTSIIDGAGSLLHRQKSKKTSQTTEEPMSIPPPLLKRNETSDMACPTKSNRQVTNEVSFPPPLLKRVDTQDLVANAPLPPRMTNRQVTNEINLPPFLKRQATGEFVNPTMNNRQVTNEAMFSNNKSNERLGMLTSLVDEANTYDNKFKTFETFLKLGRGQTVKPGVSPQNNHYSQMDKSRFINLADEDSKYNFERRKTSQSVSGRSYAINKFLKRPNLDSDGDLRDEDETSSDDDTQKNNKNEQHMDNNADATGNKTGKAFGSNLYDARLAVTNEPESQEGNHTKNGMEQSKANEAFVKTEGTNAGTSAIVSTPSVSLGSGQTTAPKRKRGRPKRNKSEGWPKRPLSAYNLFFREQRIKILDSLAPADDDEDDEDDEDEKEEEMKETGASGTGEDGRRKRGRPFGSGKKRRRAAPHGIITFENLGKKISQDWKEASPDKKEKYRFEAAANLKKYQEVLEVFLKNKEKKEAEARREAALKKISNDAIHDENAKKT